MKTVSSFLSSERVDRVQDALMGTPVIAAYLFGSQATGKAGPLSDADVGLLVDPNLDSEARFALRLKLMSTVADALDILDVDVVLLNDRSASTLLRFNAIQPSQVMFDRDPRFRKIFEFETLRDYFGEYHYQQVYGHRIRHRILSGRTI